MPGIVMQSCWEAGRHSVGCGRRATVGRGVLVDRGSGRRLVQVALCPEE